MNVFLPFWLLAKLAFFRWALREIDPSHKDVPEIVRAVNELERRLADLLWLRTPVTASAVFLSLPRLAVRALWRLA